MMPYLQGDHSKQRRRESMHLYGSTASLGSGVSNVHDDENGEKRGEINFGLEYQHKQQVLVVRVIQVGGTPCSPYTYTTLCITGQGPGCL